MSDDLHLLGRLAVHYKLLTAEQIAETPRGQARSADPRRLGELWIDAGWMTRGQLDKLLAVQREVLARQSGQAAAPLIAPKAASAPVDLEQTASGEVSTRAGKRIDRILEYAVSQRASDIHIMTGERVLMRRDGQLTFAGDAPLEHGQIERLVAEERAATGMTVVWVTHDTFQARRVADRVAFLLGGKLVEVTDADTFFTAPATAQAAAFLRGELVY